MHTWSQIFPYFLRAFTDFIQPVEQWVRCFSMSEKTELKRVYVAFPKPIWQRIEAQDKGTFTSRNSQILYLIEQGLKTNE